jgi:hypothetical protein
MNAVNSVLRYLEAKVDKEDLMYTIMTKFHAVN